MSKDDEISEALTGSWAGAAAIAGAAIGSAAVAAALLYASRRKDRADRKPAVLHHTPPETD
ncbi:hypothetical protein [Novosphingobium sp.]|uniref:hypothetical protein n=1 Tax=Novosphingobium sp. TaxID=1874826 RepID=UPI003B527163